jgi:hypothetical protein
MPERLVSFDQFAVDPETQREQNTEIHRLYARYDLNYSELMEGAFKRFDPVALNLIKHFGDRLLTEKLVIQNAVTRGLTYTQMLRNVLAVDTETPEPEPVDIPWIYYRLGPYKYQNPDAWNS